MAASELLTHTQRLPAKTDTAEREEGFVAVWSFPERRSAERGYATHVAEWMLAGGEELR